MVDVDLCKNIAPRTCWSNLQCLTMWIGTYERSFVRACMVLMSNILVNPGEGRCIWHGILVSRFLPSIVPQKSSRFSRGVTRVGQGGTIPRAPNFCGRRRKGPTMSRLCPIIAGNYLFAQLAEGIHNTSWIFLYKPLQFYQQLFAKSSATLVRSFPTFECIACLKAHT